MIAPPQVQAHNFARAIRTDIIYTLFCLIASHGTGFLLLTEPVSIPALPYQRRRKC
jgi:hypothetical protein